MSSAEQNSMGLEGFPPQAAPGNRRRNVVDELLQSLRRKRTKKEASITAHLLASCETAKWPLIGSTWPSR